MAKGQKRSNRETRKPKQAKAKPAVAVRTFADARPPPGRGPSGGGAKK